MTAVHMIYMERSKSKFIERMLILFLHSDESVNRFK